LLLDVPADAVHVYVVFAVEGTVNLNVPFWHTVAAEAVIVGVFGNA
jgi:hypothetical protein